MNLLLKQITGAYSFGAYCSTGVGGDTASLELDVVACAGKLKANSLRKKTTLRFARQALDLITIDDVFRTLFREVPEVDVTATVAAKWMRHLRRLEEWSILADTPPHSCPFTSGYFAVPKGTGDTARAIFNGARLNKHFVKPPPVNLLGSDDLLKECSDLVNDRGKPWMYTSDIRHYFHQFEACPEAQRWFAIRTETRWWKWRTMPMGWSFSPRIAQCCSWAILLHRERDEDPLCAEYEDSENPPRFVPLVRNGQRVGLLSILYDNIFVIACDKSLVKEWGDRWERNAELFGITLKHTTLHGSADTHDADYQDIEHLGLAFGTERTRTTPSGWRFLWRHAKEKKERWKPLLSTVRGVMEALDVARCVGVILWHATIHLIPLCMEAKTIHLLRRTARQVAQSGGRWRSCQMAILPDECAYLTQRLKDIVFEGTKQWTWCPYRSPGPTLMAASDASDEGMGGCILQEESVPEHFFMVAWDPGADDIIFLRELAAAELTIRRVLLCFLEQLHLGPVYRMSFPHLMYRLLCCCCVRPALFSNF
jgi:hypothetical protein